MCLGQVRSAEGELFVSDHSQPAGPQRCPLPNPTTHNIIPNRTLRLMRPKAPLQRRPLPILTKRVEHPSHNQPRAAMRIPSPTTVPVLLEEGIGWRRAWKNRPPHRP
ncbi:hypothetical protein C8Q77DRAFT_661519 [Trametes polyzona]|nr:hypothetical protein C8Q77DRAFT_661519 [Trametes polyzona]